jgi:hypothetical protein
MFKAKSKAIVAIMAATSQGTVLNMTHLLCPTELVSAGSHAIPVNLVPNVHGDQEQNRHNQSHEQPGDRGVHDAPPFAL